MHMGIFFRDENDNNDEYTGQTGDPVHDAIYGWDLGSVSDSDYHYGSEPDYSNDESSSEKTNDEKLDQILSAMYLPAYQQLILKNKLVSFLNARDCTDLTVGMGFDEYAFVFTRQNRYIKTIDEFCYRPDPGFFKRVFWDCYTTHDYDNLIKDPMFKRMIEQTGLEFVRCSGGYVTEYLRVEDEFIMEDELDLCVIFKSDGRETCYALDLNKMELTDKLY